MRQHRVGVCNTIHINGLFVVYLGWLVRLSGSILKP